MAVAVVRGTRDSHPPGEQGVSHGKIPCPARRVGIGAKWELRKEAVNSTA
jgi:hypothetical protein